MWRVAQIMKSWKSSWPCRNRRWSANLSRRPFTAEGLWQPRPLCKSHFCDVFGNHPPKRTDPHVPSFRIYPWCWIPSVVTISHLCRWMLDMFTSSQNFLFVYVRWFNLEFHWYRDQKSPHGEITWFISFLALWRLVFLTTPWFGPLFLWILKLLEIWSHINVVYLCPWYALILLGK